MKVGIVTLIHDDLHPDPGDHPETAARLAMIPEYLEKSESIDAIEFIDLFENPDEILNRVHAPEYIATVKAISDNGGGGLDEDTYVSPGSYTAARNVTGAAVACAREVMRNKHQRLLLIGRPPGHHATRDRGMGFCLFNNIAVAAEALSFYHGMKKVAIIDWDVHHGNGTQEIFYGRSDVLFVSLHQYPLYPGGGKATETGTGPGEGFTLNIPLPAATGGAQYLELFENKVISCLDDYKPDIILISAGFDGHRDDPLGGLELTESDFARMTRRLGDISEKYCEGRMISIVEGGYNPEANARCIHEHVKELVRE